MSKILGMLRGVYAEPGTIIGVDRKTLRFLAIDNSWWEEFPDERGVIKGCEVRFAMDAEITNMGMHEPNSHVEHRSLFRQPSVYGMVRQHWGNILPQRTSVNHTNECNGLCGQCPGDCGQSVCNCTCEFQGK